MNLVKRSQTVNPASLHLADNRRILVWEFQEPVGVRLSSWYDPVPGEDPFGVEGGKPGFRITPIPDACRADGAVANVIDNLGAQTFFVNSGLLWIPFACRIDFEWPDVNVDVNRGITHFEMQTTTERNEGRFCFAHYLTNGLLMNVPREVQSASCPFPFAALTMDGVSIVPFGNWPVPLGGTRTLTMGFLPGIAPAITRVPVTLYY